MRAVGWRDPVCRIKVVPRKYSSFDRTFFIVSLYEEAMIIQKDCYKHTAKRELIY